MVDALQGLEPDESKVATVSNYFFQRDAASFNLEEGELILCKPIGGKVRAAVFKGKGTFSFTPPTLIEQEQLNRQLGKGMMIMDEMRTMLLFFADSTERELSTGLTFTKRDIAANFKYIIHDNLSTIIDEENTTVDDNLAKTLLHDRDNDLFYAVMTTSLTDNLMWAIKPYAEEQMQLIQKRVTRGLTGGTIYDVINQYPSPSGSPQEYFGKGDFTIGSYTINCTIDKDLEFSATTTIRGTVSVDATDWLPFYFSDYITVSQILMNGKPVEYYHGSGKHGDCWVHMPSPVRRNDSLTFTFVYASSSLMVRLYDQTYLKSSSGWFPRSGYRLNAVFDATYHIPKRYTFVTVGDVISTSESDEIVTTRWLTPNAVHHNSFTIGVFSSKKIQDKDLHNFTIHSLNLRHRDDMMRDVAESFKFFSRSFGALDLTHFDAAEISMPHGTAYQGFVQLPDFVFKSPDNTGYLNAFTAHEVAHQWWGIGVDFENYHDQWLSEAFAEYSSLMYIQRSLEDKEKFYKLLARYRRRLIDKRESILGNSTKSGPISLGARTNTSLTDGDYALVIYEKGAWVLHMLRTMFWGQNTLDDDTFLNVMKSFYSKYKGKRVTTDDFQKTIDEVTGTKLGWFFDQWVHGTGIPKYEFAYTVVEKPDGKFAVTCRVRQHNVPPEFRMPVPICADFGNKVVSVYQVTITGADMTFELPVMDARPSELYFNFMNSVLCEVDTVDWEK